MRLNKQNQEKTEELPDYYKNEEHGERMVLQLDKNGNKLSISNIIIVRNPKNRSLDIEGLKLVSSKE